MVDVCHIGRRFFGTAAATGGAPSLSALALAPGGRTCTRRRLWRRRCRCGIPVGGAGVPAAAASGCAPSGAGGPWRGGARSQRPPTIRPRRRRWAGNARLRSRSARCGGAERGQGATARQAWAAACGAPTIATQRGTYGVRVPVCTGMESLGSRFLFSSGTDSTELDVHPSADSGGGCAFRAGGWRSTASAKLVCQA